MRKLLIGGIILLVLAAVVIVAFLNLNGIVNRNKQYILSKAEQSIGRAVSVDEIGVTLRGGIGVRLTNLKLADDPAFSKEFFIEAEDLQVNAKLWPLLKKRFEVKRAVLHGPIIRIIRNQEGVFNFSGMSRSAQPEASGTGQPVDAGTGNTTASPLMIALIDIDNGTIDYVDRRTEQTFSITRVDTRIENLDWTKPITFELKAALFSDEQNISLRGSAGPGGENMSAETMPVECDITVSGLEISRLTTALPALASKIPPELHIEGSVSARARVEKTLPSLQASGAVDGTALAIERTGQFVKPAGMPLTMEFGGHRDRDDIVIDSADLKLDVVSLTGGGIIRGGPTPGMTLDLSGKDIDLAALGAILPQAKLYALTGGADLTLHIEGSNDAAVPPLVRGSVVVKNGSATTPQLLKPVTAIDASVAFTAKRATITGANMKIGGSVVKADAEIESFEPLRASYKVSSPELALSDVRPPNPAARKPEQLKQVSAVGTMRMVGVTPVNTGNFTASQGSVGNIDFTELEGQFALDGNKATFTKINLKTMGGTATGSGTASLDPVKPSFTIKTNITGAEISKLLGTIPALEKNPLKGTVNLNADVSGSGKEWNDIKHSISGTGLTEIFQGKILEFNFIDQLFANLKQYPGLSEIVTQRIQEKYPKAFKSRDTEFKNWNSDFVLEEGKLKARNLAFFAPDYTVRGQGYLDFDKVLNLDITLFLNPNLSNDLAGEAGILKYFINAQGQLEVPLRLTGTLPKVTLMPNQAYIQETLQKGLLQQGVDKLKDKGLKDLLPKLKKKE